MAVSTPIALRELIHWQRENASNELLLYRRGLSISSLDVRECRFHMGYEWRLTECEQDMWQGLRRGYNFVLKQRDPL
jgi:hypothetical protein